MWMSAFYFGTGGGGGGSSSPGTGLTAVVTDASIDVAVPSTTLGAEVGTPVITATVSNNKITVVLPDDIIAAITGGLTA